MVITSTTSTIKPGGTALLIATDLAYSNGLLNVINQVLIPSGSIADTPIPEVPGPLSPVSPSVTPSSSSAASLSDGTGYHINVPAAVASSVIGLVLLVIAAAAVILARGRRRKEKNSGKEGKQSSTWGVVDVTGSTQGVAPIPLLTRSVSRRSTAAADHGDVVPTSAPIAPMREERDITDPPFSQFVALLKFIPAEEDELAFNVGDKILVE